MRFINSEPFRLASATTEGHADVYSLVEDHGGLDLSTDYLFDILGNLRKTTQSVQSRYFYHNSLGRLLRAKQPEQVVNSSLALPLADPVTGNNNGTVKYAYDDNGNITSTTDANNNTVTAAYDKLGRVTRRDYSGSETPDVSFYYDGTGLASIPERSKGKTTRIHTSVSETMYTSFDPFGRLLSHRQRTDGVNYDTQYAYNLSGALIEQTYPDTRVVKNTFDQDGKLSQVQSKKNSAAGYWKYAGKFLRDAAGNVTKMQLGNGLWETASFNERLQVKQIGLGTVGSIQNRLKLEFSYDSTSSGRDNNGSLRKQTITVPAAGPTPGFTAVQTYAYDDLNRLIMAEEKVASVTRWKQTFEIDRFGNREIDAVNTTTLGSCPTAVCDPDISETTNRISTAGYVYDSNGNLLENAAGERFAYDQENHQSKFFIAANSGSTPDATYRYDGEGRRIKKISSTEAITFVYDGLGKLIAEYAADPPPSHRVNYLTTDHLGSPRVITDLSGAVVSRKDFTAYGEEAVANERSLHPQYELPDVRQNYTGYQKDSETKLEFAQARYYNPAHGRFTSVDPLTASATIKDPQTLNRYSYVLNSPYKFTDPLELAATDPNPGGGCNPNWDSGCEFGGGISGFRTWTTTPNALTEAARTAATAAGATVATTPGTNDANSKPSPSAPEPPPDSNAAQDGVPIFDPGWSPGPVPYDWTRPDGATLWVRGMGVNFMFTVIDPGTGKLIKDFTYLVVEKLTDYMIPEEMRGPQHSNRYGGAQLPGIRLIVNDFGMSEPHESIPIGNGTFAEGREQSDESAGRVFIDTGKGVLSVTYLKSAYLLTDGSVHGEFNVIKTTYKPHAR